MTHPGRIGNTDRLRLYALLAAGFWTAVLALSFWASWNELRSSLLNQMRSRAAEETEKDLTYKLWNARQGGVYISKNNEIRANPFLDASERELSTSDGKSLTLINPTYMIRLANEIHSERSGIKSRIVSLDPIMVQNRADKWEAEALSVLKGGNGPVWSLSTIDGQPVFRSLTPLVVEQACIKCHERHAYRVGETRGAISVTIPMKKVWEDYNSSLLVSAFSHVAIWLIGLVFLFIGQKKLARSRQAEIQSQLEIQKSVDESREFIKSALDSLNANVAILDKDGVILHVNERWRRFSVENGWETENCGLGDNYLEVCKTADGEFAAEAGNVVNLISQLIDGKRSEFALEYPCHSPTEKRWFEVRGTKFMFGDGLRLVIAHQDITRLKTSETRFQTFVELAPVGLWATDPFGSNTYVSPNWSVITGISAERACGHGWSEGLHPDDRETTYRKWKQAALDGNPYQSYFRFVRSDGTLVWVLCQALPVRDNDNIVLEWLGTITDITALQQAQEELKAGEANLLYELEFKDAINRIFEALIDTERSLKDVAMLVLEKARQLTDSQHGYVNETDGLTGDQVSLTLTQMFGKDCEIKGPGQIRFPKGTDGLYPSLWGHSLNQLVPFFTNDPAGHPSSKGLPAGHVPLEKFLSAPVLLGNQLLGQIALSNATRDYNERDLETIVKLSAYYGMAIQKKRAQETQTILNSAINNASEGVVIADAKGRIKHVNQAFVDITGYTEQEASGKTHDFLNMKDRNNPDLIKDVWETLRTGFVWQGILRGKRKEGEIYHCACSVIPVFNQDRVVSNIVALIRDVSTELKLQEQLLQSQKMEAMGTLAGGIAHDFNNIIFAINGSAELAADMIPEISPARKYLENILKSAERASDMVRQILTFSRQDKPEKLPLNILPIIKDGIKFIRGAIPTSIEIIRNLDAVIPKINADPTQVYQVFMNLCSNAAHAMKDMQGTLTVSLKCVKIDAGSPNERFPLGSGDYVRLAVTDTGRGIPENLIGRLFEPYFTTKKPGEGTGLGLSVVHGIVESHGGAISVQSRIGEGTTFEVFFPVSDSSWEDVEESKEFYLSGTERILWVDDEQSVIDVGQDNLTKVGFQVTSSLDPLKALDIFRLAPESFDLIITDLTMPKMTGLELAAQLRSYRPDIPVIICTGYSDVASDSQILKAGVRSVIHKPISRHKLVQEIRNVLDNKS